MNWYAELRQKLVQAGFKIAQEASPQGAALGMVVIAPGGGKAAVRDRYAQAITNIMAPYCIDPMEKWAKKTGNPMPPEEEDMGGGMTLKRRPSRGAAVIPSYPARPGSYDVIFTPLHDDPPHNDTGEQSFAESIVEALLEWDENTKPPHYYPGDQDAEIQNAARSPFTAWEYATRTNQHHDLLWQRIKGSPYEAQYRKMFRI